MSRKFFESSTSSADNDKNAIKVTSSDIEKSSLEENIPIVSLNNIISPTGKVVHVDDEKVDDAMKLAAEAKEIEVTPEQDNGC